MEQTTGWPAMSDSAAAEDSPTQAAISTSTPAKMTDDVHPPMAAAMVAAAVAAAIDAATPSPSRPVTATSDSETTGGKGGHSSVGDERHASASPVATVSVKEHSAAGADEDPRQCVVVSGVPADPPDSTQELSDRKGAGCPAGDEGKAAAHPSTTAGREETMSGGANEKQSSKGEVEPLSSDSPRHGGSFGGKDGDSAVSEREEAEESTSNVPIMEEDKALATSNRSSDLNEEVGRDGVKKGRTVVGAKKRDSATRKAGKSEETVAHTDILEEPTANNVVQERSSPVSLDFGSESDRAIAGRTGHLPTSTVLPGDSPSVVGDAKSLPAEISSSGNNSTRNENEGLAAVQGCRVVYKGAAQDGETVWYMGRREAATVQVCFCMWMVTLARRDNLMSMDLLMELISYSCD